MRYNSIEVRQASAASMYCLQIYGPEKDGTGKGIVYFKCDKTLKSDKIVSAGSRWPDTVIRVSTPRLCPCA